MLITTRNIKKKGGLFQRGIALAAVSSMLLATTACSTVWDHSGRHSGSAQDFDFGRKAPPQKDQKEHAQFSPQTARQKPSSTRLAQAERAPDHPDSSAQSSAGSKESVQAEAAPQSQPNVLPRYRGIKLERYGNVRWIAVHASAAWVWARSQKFLKQAGLDIAHARPKEGFMETEWGARAPNVPLNFINSIFRAHVDSSVRYRFRLRLERDPKADGIIDVYLTEQRAQKATEKNTTYRESGGAVWQPVKTDPDVEALMLARLMVALGDARNSAQAAVQNPPQNQPLIRIGQTGNGNAAALEIKAPFADAWRAVQAALDRTAAQVDPKPRAAKFLVETTHNMSFSLSLQPANQYTRVYIKTHSDAPTDAALRLARQLRSALT